MCTAAPAHKGSGRQEQLDEFPVELRALARGLAPKQVVDEAACGAWLDPRAGMLKHGDEV